MKLTQLLTGEVIAALWAAGFDIVRKGECPPWMEVVKYGSVFDLEDAGPFYRMKEQ